MSALHSQRPSQRGARRDLSCGQLGHAVGHQVPADRPRRGAPSSVTNTAARPRTRRAPLEPPTTAAKSRQPAQTDERAHRPAGKVRARDGEATTSPWAGLIRVKRIFDFLKSREARMSCPFCGHEQWQGWDERVALEHVIGSKSVDRKTEAFPLTCANCGFIRFQSAHVLDDPRASTRNAPEASE